MSKEFRILNITNAFSQYIVAVFQTKEQALEYLAKAAKDPNDTRVLRLVEITETSGAEALNKIYGGY